MVVNGLFSLTKFLIQGPHIYDTKVSEPRKWETWPPLSSDESKNFDFLYNWVITHTICSAVQSMISWWVKIFCSLFITFRTSVRMSINPQKAGGWGKRVNLIPLCGFSKNASSRERVKPWLFVTFNIIISHIFLENFMEISQIVQKIWRFSPSI